jgi:hypothetical protein
VQITCLKNEMNRISNMKRKSWWSSLAYSSRLSFQTMTHSGLWCIEAWTPSLAQSALHNSNACAAPHTPGFFIHWIPSYPALY